MTASASASPFVGLRAFTAEDADRFFARELWTRIIMENVVAFRLTLLYGESGVGKTSLLQAGVEHQLALNGAGRSGRRSRTPIVPIVFRTWQGEPVRPLIEQVHRAARPPRHGDDSWGTPPPSLVEATRECCGRVSGRVVLILDQYEEYLLYHGREEGPQSLPAQLAQVVDEPGLQASVLIAIREDALSKLDPLRRALPHLFDNALHLERVGVKAAAETITGPIQWYNEHYAGVDERVEVDDELVRAVIAEVTARATPLTPGEPGEAPEANGTENGEEVEFPYLQLVLERIWHEAAQHHVHRLDADMLRDAGGATEIIRDHVRQAAGSLSDEQRDTAAEAFRYLVTPSGAKIAYTVTDLAKQIGCERDVLAAVLEQLSLPDARVLRPVGVATAAGIEDGVEIYHDKLAAPIRYWCEEHRVARAKELARLEARRAERERLRRWRVIALVSLTLLVAAITSVLLAIALHQKHVADTQRRAAEASSRLANSNAYAALSAQSQDPQQALALAIQANLSGTSEQATTALRNALVASRVRWVRPTGVSAAVRVAYLAGGRVLITANNDGTLRAWDVGTGRLLWSRQTGGPIRDLAVSPDGRLLATASLASSGHPGIAVWSAATGREVGTPESHGLDQQPFALAFSPTSGVIASAWDNYVVRVWRPGAASDQQLGEQPGSPTGVAFSPDGRHFVTTSVKGASEWTAGSAGAMHILATGAANGAAFSRDGRLIVTADADGTAKLWDAQTGAPLRTLSGHTGPVTMAVFSPDGQVVATAGADQTARLWNAADGTTRAVLVGHAGRVTSVAFNADGSLVVTASQDGTARVWSTATTGRSVYLLGGHTGSVLRAVFSPSGTTVATVSSDRTARIWDIWPLAPAALSIRHDGIRPIAAEFAGASGGVTAVFADGAVLRGRAVVRAPGGNASAAAVTSDGARVVIVPAHGSAQVLDAGSGRVLRTLNPPRPIERLLVVARNTEMLTVASDAAQLWSLPSLRRVASFVPPPIPKRGHQTVSAAAVSEDGKLAMLGTSAGELSLWDARRGRLLATGETSNSAWLTVGDGETVTAVAISPNAALAATASADGVVRVWDLRRQTLLTTLIGHQQPVSDIEFSRDGKELATAGVDGTTRVWDPSTGRILALLEPHGGPVLAASFSPDGQFVLDVAADGIARVWLWRLSTGPLAEVLAGGISTAHFDTTGSRIVATTRTGPVSVYPCQLCGGVKDLMTLAQARQRAR